MSHREDYEHDCFISYRRVSIVAQWLARDEFFHDLLTSYLTMNLQRRPCIFQDVLSLAPGDDFPNKIELALRRSRCLVVIGTADYFSSTWCTAEFDAFMDRSRLTNRAVIVPLAWHDWSPPPPELGNILVADFHPIAFIGAKKDASTSVPFQQTMKTFCDTLAQRIEQAPAFDPTWKAVVPRVDDVYQPKILRPRQPE